MLNAIKNLNGRLEAIEEKVDDNKIKDLKDILESQSLIDEIVVNNSDDIAIMKKVQMKIRKKTNNWSPKSSS